MAQRRKRAKAKVNIPICLAAVLFCLTLISLHLSSGVIARYSATSDGMDSARVIVFDALSLTENEANGNKQIIYPGAKLKWNAEVSFAGSESATYVFLEVIPKNVGDEWKWTVSGREFTALAGLTWSVDDEWNVLDGYPGVFYRSLGPNTALENVPVVKDGAITVAETLEADDLAKIVAGSEKFGFSCAASVVQSNGFDKPETAWASLKAKHQA